MFRFTIRDLLWLTVVVAFASAWFVDHRALKMKAESLGWRVAVLSAKQVTAHHTGAVSDEEAVRLLRSAAGIGEPNP